MIDQFIAFFEKNDWVLWVFLTVFSTGLIHALARRVWIHFLKKTSHLTNHYLYKATLYAMKGPLACLIWLLGVTLAADIADGQAVTFSLLNYTALFRKLGILIILTWFVLNILKQAERAYITYKEDKNQLVDKTLVHALVQLLSVSTIITAILIIMQIFNIPISGLLAFGGIGGAGVAFAAKDLLANFFGSLVIYLDRPFKVGDWISSPDKNIEGTVEHIGWRVTRIRTFDMRPLYVPNGVFLTISVENPSRMKNRRIKTLVGLRYDDAEKMADIVQAVESMLRAHDAIDKSRTLFVNFTEFGASSLNFLVYTFTKTTNWVKFQQIQQDVFLKIIKIVEEHGAECAFPTQTVHVPKSVHIQSQPAE